MTDASIERNTTIIVFDDRSVEVVDNVFDDEDPMKWTVIRFATAYVLLQTWNGCFEDNIMEQISIDRCMLLTSASIYCNYQNFAELKTKIIACRLSNKYEGFQFAAAPSTLLCILLFC